MKKRLAYLIAGIVLALVFVFAALNYFAQRDDENRPYAGNGPGLINRITETPDVVGVEVYDLSMYEESYQQSTEERAELDEWFPRQAVVQPKGPEGGEFPNAPLPIYDAYPGQEGVNSEGETYSIIRTWIGDIAVGAEVTLEGMVGQGEWCFVTGETIGGWTSSGWVWCYRLLIPE